MGQAACSWLHTFASQEPKCTEQTCTFYYYYYWRVYSDGWKCIFVHLAALLLEGREKKQGSKKKSITRKGKNLVTQFSKLYEAWHSMLRKTPDIQVLI